MIVKKSRGIRKMKFARDHMTKDDLTADNDHLILFADHYSLPDWLCDAKVSFLIISLILYVRSHCLERRFFAIAASILCWYTGRGTLSIDKMCKPKKVQQRKTPRFFDHPWVFGSLPARFQGIHANLKTGNLAACNCEQWPHSKLISTNREELLQTLSRCA